MESERYAGSGGGGHHFKGSGVMPLVTVRDARASNASDGVVCLIWSREFVYVCPSTCVDRVDKFQHCLFCQSVVQLFEKRGLFRSTICKVLFASMNSGIFWYFFVIFYPELSLEKMKNDSTFAAFFKKHWRGNISRYFKFSYNLIAAHVKLVSFVQQL